MSDHRELFDEQYAAEMRRLVRRRVMLITLGSAVGGAMIIGGFLLFGWIHGERLPIRKRDRFAMITVGTLSERINGLTIRLDQERWRKHRERDGRITLSYAYEDGPIAIRSHIEVHEDETAARQAMEEIQADPLGSFPDKDFELISPQQSVMYGDHSVYGSLARQDEKIGHIVVIRVGRKLMLSQLVGHHLNEEQLSILLGQAVATLETYQP